MILWPILTLMTLGAVIAVWWPLARRQGSVRSGSDIAVYRDQLDEIDRDLSFDGMVSRDGANYRETAARFTVRKAGAPAAGAAAAQPSWLICSSVTTRSSFAVLLLIR
jgi:cytochrome c-type biogenesis protein CcmH